MAREYIAWFLVVWLGLADLMLTTLFVRAQSRYEELRESLHTQERPPPQR